MRGVAGVIAGGLLGLALHSGPASAEVQVDPAEARVIAKEATIYGFPMVDNYRILHAYFVDTGDPEYKAPWNVLHNTDRVFTPEDKAIQTPNSDTPYSQLGVDLRAEPLVLSVPAVEADRYYSLQFIDLYTFNFGYVGSRATGNAAGDYLLAGPGWSGATPAGIDGVIRSETDFAFVLYRTQLKGAADIANVRAVQAGYKVQPLSAFLGATAPEAAPPIAFFPPLDAEEERTSLGFFDELNFLLQFAPTHPSEVALRERFAEIGIVPGQPSRAEDLSPEMRDAISAGMADAYAELADFKTTMIDTGILSSADGFGSREFLANDYMRRMASAAFGIYGNSKEEAIYPAYFVDLEGAPLDGAAGRYELRFGPDELPPANSFWSLTMYELPASLLVANPIERYLINLPMLPDLKRDVDGGITLYIQRESPGPERQSNWLPAPDGPFWAAVRLYWPRPEALDGTWKQPALRRIEEAAATVPVTVENFARAESDLYFAGVVQNGGFEQFDHNRELAPLDKQTVIRLNRDTLYSAAVFDLDAGPVTITLPDPGERFMSMQVIDEDHYTHGVFHEPGAQTFTREGIGTRYVVTAIRTLVDPNDPDDVAEVHALQDAVTIAPRPSGVFELPAWDSASQAKVRNALIVLADTLPDKNHMFGGRNEVDPVRFLLGAASAWGGNPDNEAMYLNIVPEKNDGETVYRLTAKDVPVDGFWSVSVYNADGYFQPNPLDAYTLNNITAARDDDGAITVQFGGCDGKVVNCLPTPPGWNYMVRLYRPHQTVLDGSWTFPDAIPVN